MKLNNIVLVDGSGDIACDACRDEALREIRKNSRVAGVVRIETSDPCGWCGISDENDA